jgi:hypothetical protein
MAGHTEQAETLLREALQILQRLGAPEAATVGSAYRRSTRVMDRDPAV